ncbi:McrB family protein [Vibrio splendidus]|uniref:McrB family protein n=1 Tax=Vibrio splendidus TaxID=29497 RepID=UPI00223695D4|nr:AAA family ATPase [Vibrio splendidus]MCW4440045.1 AAA family ATPase [Vibrio splendidus]
MNVIKQYLIECGYTEEFLETTDVRFDEPKLIILIEKWQHQPSLRKFVEFAARFHLTPYSGNRDCLLFKLEVAGSSVRNTVLGGFNGSKQEFEFAGTRFNPEKISSALNSNSGWLRTTSELKVLAQQLNVFFDENEKPTPKYFWVKMSRSDIDSVLDQLIDKWLVGVQGSTQLTSVSIEEYFTQVFESRDGNNGEWIREYRAYNQLTVEEKTASEFAIKELWTKASTWVASIKNGIMSGEDYRKSESDLVEFTRLLARGTSPELYNQSIALLNRLAEEGKISRRYWATTNRVFASLHPTKLSTAVAEEALRKVYQYLDIRFQLKLKNLSTLNWYELNQELLSKIQPILKGVMDTDAVNVTLWYIYESITETPAKETSEVREPASNYGEKLMNIPLNQILYGPPGTGKTYHTIEAAVQAADPDFYASINIDPKTGVSEEQRDSLTKKYKALTDAGRIRFVTFHQSYGYEEFVEGLSATTTNNDQIKYSVKDGVFKALVCEATKNIEDSQKNCELITKEQKFDLALDSFKASAFEESDSFPLTEAVSIVTIEDEGFRYCGEWKSSQIMKFEDLKSLYLADVQTRQDVKRADLVSGLAKQHATYFIKALKRIEGFIPSEVPVYEKKKKQNYVLVIDEINRGNISKIFGELITLIEPSKRLGAVEEIEVMLPHTPGLFSVPDNLYIIGTMNTADRSLAMMDTALRRRFDFKEMMPNPKLFADKEVKGINLSKLLETLNKRIEVLYDREHTLGHAFLFPVFNEVDEGKAFIELQSAFKNKIIPLLEEYFYEDWSKIRLVLGDSLKQDEGLQFLQRTEDFYSELFGPEHGLELYEDCKVTYSFKPFGEGTVWQNPTAFKTIYAKDSE